MQLRFGAERPVESEALPTHLPGIQTEAPTSSLPAFLFLPSMFMYTLMPECFFLHMSPGYSSRWKFAQIELSQLANKISVAVLCELFIQPSESSSQ